jgi:hypothetical protein
MNATSLTYVQFDSYDALAEDSATLESLIALYRTVFGDPAGWAESYSRADVVHKLQAELAGHASLRAAKTSDGSVVAFCWAQSLGVDDVMRCIETIKFYQSAGMPDLEGRLAGVMGDRNYIYVHELAIDATFRGRVPFTELIYPVLCGVAERAHVDHVLFWSVADTLMSRFARRALFDHRLTMHGMEFHIGRFTHEPGVSRDVLRWSAPGRTMRSNTGPIAAHARG